MRRKPESEIRYPRSGPLPTPLGRTAVLEILSQLLHIDTMGRFARESHCGIRERTIDPPGPLWTLVLDFGVELHRFLEELHYACFSTSDLEDLAYASYYLRLHAELCQFPHLYRHHAIAQLPGEPGRELDPRLRASVEDMVVMDSLGVRLRAGLATKSPSTDSREVGAACRSTCW